jgi:hypothetical protein
MNIQIERLMKCFVHLMKIFLESDCGIRLGKCGRITVITYTFTAQVMIHVMSVPSFTMSSGIAIQENTIKKKTAKMIATMKMTPAATDVTIYA